MISALAFYILPLVFGGLVVVIFARWLFLFATGREAATSFTLDFIPFASDVRAAEVSLPDMRNIA